MRLTMIRPVAASSIPLLLGLACAVEPDGGMPGTAEPAALTPELLEGLRFRSIGPAVTGGRGPDNQGGPGGPSLPFVCRVH